MKKNVKWCSTADRVLTAAEMMRDENIGFLPICDQNMRVHGTVTDRDLVVRVIADKKTLDATCGTVMTKNPITCHPDDNLVVALERMRRNRISRIICVDGQDVLAGVISLSDVAQKETDEHVAQTIRGVTKREVATEKHPRQSVI